MCKNRRGMVKIFLLVCAALALSIAHSADLSRQSAPPAAQSATQPATPAREPRVSAVTSNGPGQAGYVHYFLITHADDSLEYHVGIELEDQRIAWSFPNAGVIVSEFVKKGVILANGMPFKIEHLHGIRPFSGDAQMRVLQKELTARVAQWVDDETPYCLLRTPGQRFCLSCGDFVVRILFPGVSPLVPALPRDFTSVSGLGYTTDDLLLYMTGLHNLPDKKSQLERLATLGLPANMRDDIATMIDNGEPDVPATAVAAKPAPATPIARKPAVSPPTGNKVASRRPQAKKI